ncbi:MAG TPA: hypothetical protein VKW06_13545 [Candidatus Angelobacter sp.]|nr:hypothetical protein [Candidatus Angelobacter sp.]
MPKLQIMAALVVVALARGMAQAQESLTVPQAAAAGQEISLQASGSGNGTLYLIGPAQVIKREVQLSQPIRIKGEEVRSAGRWTAILRADGRSSAQTFFVDPGPVENLSFLARPSRVPVARPSAISGIVFVFDKYQNLVLQPTPVKFSLSVEGTGASQAVTSRYGVAWISSSSARKAGAAQFVAAADDVSVRRVVQQVASDPCNLRMHVAGHSQNGITVETDPIRDCTGNPVPDGTIVTFIQTDSNGRSTVDARIKKGVARADLPSSNNATISVASGVVLGNELHVGGGQ